MLSKDELEKIMMLKGLNIVQTEKDYVQNLLLYVIYSVLGRELVFKGGTCMYKIYGLNRFSEDLDFSLVKHFDFQKSLKKILFIAGQAGINGRIKMLKEYQNQANIDLEFKGPLYTGNPKSTCFIGLDISMREMPLLQPEKYTIYSDYKDVPDFDVFAMKLEEILLEKIAAVYNRKKARDVYDVWFLLKNKNVQINLKLLQKKLQKNKIKFDKSIFIEKIEEKKSFWKTDVVPLITGNALDFPQVKKEIEERI